MPLDKSKPVLVIDDNFAILRIVKALLEPQGFGEVDGAGTGPEAIRKLTQRPFGVVICDYFMMPMNGIDVKRLMDRKPELASIPFLMMTTKEETFDRSKFDKAGIYHIILKPFTAEGLMAAIEAAAAEPIQI